ncbi:hypothetical protein DZF79_02915 [Vibrio parahaemolyticus]|nr:hypothetical protein [Vibrio parahaemolyticus]
MTKYAVISFENSTVSRVMAEFPKNCQPTPMVYADEAGDSFDLMSDLIDSTCSAIDGEVVQISIDAKDVYETLRYHGHDVCYDELGAEDLFLAVKLQEVDISEVSPTTPLKLVHSGSNK